MSLDLFEPQDYTQEEYRDRWLKDRALEEADQFARGIIAPHLEDQYELDKDERALLDLIIDHNGLEYDKRRIRTLMGFNSTGNYLATEAKCKDKGLIDFITVSGTVYMVLTQRGRWIYDMDEEDRGFSE